MSRERNQTVFFLNVGLCLHVTERLFDWLKNLTKHFVHMEPLNFSLSQSFCQIGNSAWTSEIINMTKNCEKSQLTREIVTLAIFHNFRNSAFKKSPTFRFVQFFVNTRKIVIFAAACKPGHKGFHRELTNYCSRFNFKFKMASPNLVPRVRKGRDELWDRDRASPIWTTPLCNYAFNVQKFRRRSNFQPVRSKIRPVSKFLYVKGAVAFWSSKFLNG